MGERLLLLRRERRFVGDHVRRPTGLLILGCSRNRMLNHRATEYRRVRTQTHAMRRPSSHPLARSVDDLSRFPGLLGH